MVKNVIFFIALLLAMTMGGWRITPTRKIGQAKGAGEEKVEFWGHV